VAGSVKRIQFNYADGRRPVSQARLDGAFGLVIEANRRPSSLTGYDKTGHLIARFDLSNPTLGFRYCTARGCPPWRK
jgi:hypothetical protein